MKYYYYFLFRLYNTLSDPRKKNDIKTINYLTTSTSTFVICFFLITIIFYVDFYFFKIVNFLLPNKEVIIFCLFCLGLLNYFLIIKNKLFLNYKFKADKQGGYAIIFVLVLLVLAFIFIINQKK